MVAGVIVAITLFCLLEWLAKAVPIGIVIVAALIGIELLRAAVSMPPTATFSDVLAGAQQLACRR